MKQVVLRNPVLPTMVATSSLRTAFHWSLAVVCAAVLVLLVLLGLAYVEGVSVSIPAFYMLGIMGVSGSIAVATGWIYSGRKKVGVNALNAYHVLEAEDGQSAYTHV